MIKCELKLSQSFSVKYLFAMRNFFNSVRLVGKFLRSLIFGYNISGPEIQRMAPLVYSVLLPPVIGIEMVDSYKTISLPQFDLDWEFVYDYVGVKVKDMILEVRSQSDNFNRNRVLIIISL